MTVSLSRYTPGLKCAGKNIIFDQGEKVLYRDNKGKLVWIIIDSEPLLANKYAGKEAGELSYDSIYTDTDERAGAIAKRIIWWKGKPELKPEI